MDLKLSTHRATHEEQAAIDALLGQQHERHAHLAYKPDVPRDRLLPLLHAVNDRVGWISRGAINYIAERTDIAPAEVYGVATFYGLFATTEREARQVHVCIDLACLAAGATQRCRTALMSRHASVCANEPRRRWSSKPVRLHAKR